MPGSRPGSSRRDQPASPTAQTRAQVPPPVASSIIYSGPDTSPRARSSPLLASSEIPGHPQLEDPPTRRSNVSGSSNEDEGPVPALAPQGLSLGSVFGRRGSILPRQAEPSGSLLVPRRKGKEREGDIELVEVNAPERVPATKIKEDVAMAKWRKWVVEQPLSPSGDLSPINGRKASSVNVPMTPSRASLRGPHSPSPTPRQLWPPSSPASPGSPSSPGARSRSRSPSRDSMHLPHSGSGSASSSSASPARPSSTHPSSVDHGTGTVSTPAQLDFYNTESVRALRDVELAVDDEVLARAVAMQAPKRSMSSYPRLSTLENPFFDLATRLSSRRVRPIVLELVHSLGHYVDAVWSVTYPSTPIPWANEPNQSGSPGPSSALTWKSRMLTAVQEGKRSGHVPSPPSGPDLRFYRDEVRYALQDVDDTVGIFKGVMWAFMGALQRGAYGDVEEDNVLGHNGSGGNMARMLNDLEEALWGDAPPRSTDLAYELPEGFDPFAEPDPEDLQSKAASSTANPLSDFFRSDGQGATPIPASSPFADMPSSDPFAVPDLVVEMDSAGSDGRPGSPTAQSGHGQERHRSVDTDVSTSSSSSPSVAGSAVVGRAVAQAWGIGNPAGEMTLEEIGRKRHEEWLATRRPSVWQ